MRATVHVVGAGLSGLAAAVDLAESGERLVVHEAMRFAGGRVRSYHDSVIDAVIDNGNHLLLSGNRAALDYLSRIGARDRLSDAGDGSAAFPFADLKTGDRWTLRPNGGRLPWWILDSRRRVPGSRASDYLAPLGVLRARPGATVGEVMDCSGPLYERLWRPVLLSALNTEPAEADAALAAGILRETLAAGGDACRPLVALMGLSETFIDPALALIRRRGGEIRFGAGLKAIRTDSGRALALDFADGPLALGPDDAVVLAVPAVAARGLLPEIAAPSRFHAILNAHFRVAPPPGQPAILGVVGGTTEWLFAYPDRLSVTVSAADRLMDRPREDLAKEIWREVARLAGLGSPRLDSPMPRWQIVRERRATFSATPAQNARRPATLTRLANLALAGDWTATGLPSTIEGSIRSGFAAAALIRDRAFAARRDLAAA